MSIRLFVAVLLSAVVASPGALAAPAKVTIDGATTYQAIDGFGVSINPHSWDGGAAVPALDLLRGMGVQIWRVSYDMTDWEATNDDADPAHFNWTSYNAIFTSPAFEELWSTVRYLNQNGFGTSVMLDFFGRVPAWMGGSALNPSSKDEFVETMLALVYYARFTRGLQFGLLAPLNETDWDGFEGPQVGAADFADVMNRIALRLDALGMADVRLVGPDTALSIDGTGPYLDAMVGYPKLMAHVNAIATHNYSEETTDMLAEIRATAYPARHRWVTETSSIFAAWSHLELGSSAVLMWEGYDSVYEHAILAGRGSVAPNDAGPQPAVLAYSGGVYTKRSSYYDWQQLFGFVAPGAVRIAASTSANGIHALAFRHPTTGRVTIVGRNDNASAQALSFSLSNVGSLSALNAYATNQDMDFSHLNDVAVVGGVATFTAPYNSIFTLTAMPGTLTGSSAVPLPSWAAWSAGCALLGVAALVLGARRAATAT